MNERYEAVFCDSVNGTFTVVCRGYFKRDKKPGCFLPTVEEAMEEYSSNCKFVGLK